MTKPDLSSDDAIARYRAEIRVVGRTQRLAGFGLIVLGAILVWAASQAGGMAEMLTYGGYGALAAGWGLMIYAIFLRTRYHRRRMREMN